MQKREGGAHSRGRQGGIKRLHRGGGHIHTFHELGMAGQVQEVVWRKVGTLQESGREPMVIAPLRVYTLLPSLLTGRAG